MTDAIQKDELEAEIRTLKTKKTPGPDGVTNDMILHLGPSAKKPFWLFLTNPDSQAPFQLCGKRPRKSLFTRKEKTRNIPAATDQSAF